MITEDWERESEKDLMYSIEHQMEIEEQWWRWEEEHHMSEKKKRTYKRKKLQYNENSIDSVPF